MVLLSVSEGSHWFCLCVSVWKGLSPAVKITSDNRKSPPGPDQGTEGDTSVSKTGTADVAKLLLMHSVRNWSLGMCWHC